MSKRAYLEGATPYPPDVIEEYAAKGWWLNMTYGDLLDRSTSLYPDKPAVIDENIQLTYAQLKEKVDRLAIAFLKLGIKRYDRLLLQLPNRHEFVVAFYAMQRIGAVPILAVPRQEYSEISHFFKVMEPVGWIVPVRDGNREFVPLIDKIRAESKSLKYLIMVEDDDPPPPDALSMKKLIADVKLDIYASSVRTRTTWPSFTSPAVRQAFPRVCPAPITVFTPMFAIPIQPTLQTTCAVW
jgi:non-ribosomal peptide synthetase component E (peptide arylation enzyme)